MEQILEAIYSNGLLRPLEPLRLREDQRVIITVREPSMESPEQALASWQTVYQGLSDEEIEEVEEIALDRKHFVRERD